MKLVYSVTKTIKEIVLLFIYSTVLYKNECIHLFEWCRNLRSQDPFLCVLFIRGG